MCGARITGGLDLTFEVYGHLIDRHERIIGLVCEAAWGRLVSSSDRSLVYSAMVKLQNRGLIYKGCLTNRFVIADNKVRLVELNQIAWQYHNEDPQKFEKYAQTYHWNQLEQLFEELDQIGPHGNSRLPLIKFTAIAATAKNIVFLPSTSSPYLRVSDSHSRREIFIERVFSFLNDLPDDENEDRPYNALTRNSAPRRRRALLFSISSSSSTRNMYVFASPAPPAPITPNEDDDRTEPAQDAESKNLTTGTMRASRAPALAGPPHSQARRTRTRHCCTTSPQSLCLHRRHSSSGELSRSRQLWTLSGQCSQLSGAQVSQRSHAYSST